MVDSIYTCTYQYNKYANVDHFLLLTTHYLLGIIC